jgi:hypothetical protein
MTDDRGLASCVLVINLERSSQPVAEIATALAPLGIPVDVVDSGHQLRWTATLVLRVPTERAEEAMLALALKGFGNVLAYESDHAI